MWINLGNLSARKDPNLVRCKLSDPGARTNSQCCSASFVELCQLFVAICCNLVPTKITLQFEHPHIFGFWAPKVPCRNPEIDSTITTTTNDSRVIPGTLNNGTPLWLASYTSTISHIFRDSYGSGMGIVWEAYHKGVPWLGVPENPIEWWIGICSLLRYALSKLASDFRASCINGTSHISPFNAIHKWRWLTIMAPELEPQILRSALVFKPVSLEPCHTFWSFWIFPPSMVQRPPPGRTPCTSPVSQIVTAHPWA